MLDEIDDAIEDALETGDIDELVELLDQLQCHGYESVLRKMTDADLYVRFNDEFQDFLDGSLEVDGLIAVRDEVRRRGGTKLKLVLPNEYSNSIIYTMTSTQDPSLQYLGSSTLLPHDRKQKHEQRGRTIEKTTAKLYLKMKEGHRFKMAVVEYADLNSRRELEKKEQQWINKLKPKLNCKKAYRSKKKK